MPGSGPTGSNFFETETPPLLYLQPSLLVCLQIPSLQHPQKPALPHEGRSTAPGPSAHHLPPRLLQLTPGWISSLRNQTSAVYLERRRIPHGQPAKVLRCDPPPP